MAERVSRFKTLMATIGGSSPVTDPIESEDEIPAVEQLSKKNLGTIPSKSRQPEIVWIERSKIHRDPDQDRRYFDPDELGKMARSMEKVSILDPLVVRPRPNTVDEFDLLAGEKRHRSAEIAQISVVPCRVFEVDDDTAADIKAISNLQRGDLNKWEETNAIMGMLCRNLQATSDEVISLLNRAANQKRGLTGNVVRSEELQIIDDVFSLVGRLTPESFRKHRVPLLRLPHSIQQVLRQGRLSYTKVNEILKVKDPEKQQQLLKEAQSKDLSVDAIQQRVKELRQKQKGDESEPPEMSHRLATVTKGIKKSQIWLDTDKYARLNMLLQEIESLLE